MTSLQRRLLCSVAIPMCLGFGAVAIVTIDTGGGSAARAQSANPCSPCGAANPCNPCSAAPAGKTDCYVPRLRQAQANPCAAKNPCAANPCAAAKPCNSCAAKNPCAAEANPCATTNPCAAATKPCNPCNPCAAKNPCAAAGADYASFVVPVSAEKITQIRAALSAAGFEPGSMEGRIDRQAVMDFQRAQGLAADGLIGEQTLAALESNVAAACNPCAAKTPCAAANRGAAANPCNPCAAKNPCAAAGPCNPCNPCGAAAQPPDVTPDELRAVYDCLHDYMRSAYGGQEDGKSFASGGMPRLRLVAYSDSDLDESKTFLDWKNFATTPYPSQTHGNRFVVNHANSAAEEAYGKYEEIGTMPQGGIVAKPSFTVAPNGDARLGPLFLMEKMASGWHPESGDWRYTMLMPDGTISGRTRGPNAEAVEFCIGCHAAVADGQDSLFFMPEEFRVK